MHENNGYHFSIISVSIIDIKVLDKKMFVNNIVYLFILSLINFNLFLLKTWKNVQCTLVRYFVTTLFQLVQSSSTTEDHSRGKNYFLFKEIELFFIDLENYTFYSPAFLRKWAFSGLFENYKTIILSEKS